ncbi:hypothetical protein Mapa_009896 [Marchantia paleacea]|nr:hypothetical protein Mapa_009896 [Marchantia paleacea]
MAIPGLCVSCANEDNCECGRSTTTPGTLRGDELSKLGVCGRMMPAVNNEKKKDRINCDVDICASDDYPLIPGLPDHISKAFLAEMPRASFPHLQLVNRSWKRFFKSEELFDIRRQNGVAEACIYVLAENPRASPFVMLHPRADKWVSLPPTPGHSKDQVWEGFSCVSVRSFLFVMGGTRRSTKHPFSTGEMCGDVWRYDAKTNKWDARRKMVPARSWHAATAIGDRIYVAGGSSPHTILHSAQVYDVSSDSWSPLPDMEHRRFSCQGLTLNQEFWVVAGEFEIHNTSNTGPEHGSVEIYDPKTNSWRLVADVCLDAEKVAGPMVVADGKLLCVHQRTVREYKGGKNWEILGYVSSGDLSQRPYPRFGFGLVSLEKEVFVIGGARESWQNQTRCTIQNLDTVEVCNVEHLLKSRDSCTELSWRDASPMGMCRGTILATALVWL